MKRSIRFRWCPNTTEPYFFDCGPFQGRSYGLYARTRAHTRASRLFPNRKRLEDPGNGRPDLPRAHTYYITRARARARMRRRIHAHRRAQRHGDASYGRRYPYGGDRPSQGALGRTVGTIPQTGKCGYGRSSPDRLPIDGQQGLVSKRVAIGHYMRSTRVKSVFGQQGVL